MKKFCIRLLIFLSFSVSAYLVVTNSVEETSNGPAGVVIFSIPFTMLLVESSLFLLPKLMKFQDSYVRYKKGFESIFLSIILILTMVHVGLILLVTGTNVNLILLIPLGVGIVLITTANTLPRFQLELFHSPKQLTS